MTNQQIPSYSGVTINITNPTVNAGGYTGNYPNGYSIQPGSIQNGAQQIQIAQPADNVTTNPITNTAGNQIPEQSALPQAYPPQYYLNNYNYVQGDSAKTAGETTPAQSAIPAESDIKSADENSAEANTTPADSNLQNTAEEAQSSAVTENENTEEDLSSSKEIINKLETQNEERKELKKNGKKTRVVALTNEYIMSLENYLNNPNDEIRLMASKEILTRLDEDKSRFDDAALNALLNKMLQDPDKLVRIAALSAFASRLASGNDYTIQLLNNIQQNPNSDPEDVVQAADILLKMSASTEIKYTPAENNAEIKEEK